LTRTFPTIQNGIAKGNPATQKSNTMSSSLILGI
jgi:hypothetical protein